MGIHRFGMSVVEATQWYRNGDHPKDDVWRVFEDTGKKPTKPRAGAVVRRYRRPDVDGDSLCRTCDTAMGLHGWIDTPPLGHTVCPGDWVITDPMGTHRPCPPHIFNANFTAASASKPTEQWAWAYPGAERAHGPFDSREEAIASHRRDCDVPDEPGYSHEINVGRTEPFNAADFLLDADAIEEHIACQADDAGWDTGDWCEIGQHVHEGADANTELRAALAAWTKRWISCDSWRIRSDAESIEITYNPNEENADA